MEGFESELARIKSKRNPYADWRDDALLQCNRHMWEKQINCDVKFIVGGEFGAPEEFCCHKYVLVSRSPVMNKQLGQTGQERRDSQFNHQMSLPKGVYSDTESVDGDDVSTTSSDGVPEEENVIRVPDVHPEAFYEMLRYIYYEKADIDDENVFAVYYAAYKYHMRLLEETCKIYIRKNFILDSSNVCHLLDTSLFYKAYFLSKDCVDYIDAHPAVSQSEAFKSMSQPALERVYIYFNAADKNK